MNTDRLRACVESVARTREVVAARLDVGDGWAGRLAQTEADRDRYRREAAETSDLLELCLLQHLHLRGHLDDLRDTARLPPGPPRRGVPPRRPDAPGQAMTEASGSAAYRTPAPVVVESYFACWKRRSTGRWSRIHWFRQGVPVCGIVEPTDDEAEFVLPPEPMLTCVACQRLNQAMREADRG